MSIKVLLADDTAIMRNAIRHLLWVAGFVGRGFSRDDRFFAVTPGLTPADLRARESLE
jgi:FixJ family two-component response regulator